MNPFFGDGLGDGFGLPADGRRGDFERPVVLLQLPVTPLALQTSIASLATSPRQGSQTHLGDGDGGVGGEFGGVLDGPEEYVPLGPHALAGAVLGAGGRGLGDGGGEGRELGPERVVLLVVGLGAAATGRWSAGTQRAPRAPDPPALPAPAPPLSPSIVVLPRSAPWTRLLRFTQRTDGAEGSRTGAARAGSGSGSGAVAARGWADAAVLGGGGAVAVGGGGPRPGGRRLGGPLRLRLRRLHQLLVVLVSRPECS